MWKMGNCCPHSLSFQFPVWPVWKPNGKWRLTVDCCWLSADTDPLAAEVPNISELTAPMQEQAHGLMTTTDIKDMFCMVPWQQWGQHQLAFVYGATMYLHRASSGLQSFTHLSSPCAGKKLEKIPVEWKFTRTLMIYSQEVIISRRLGLPTITHLKSLGFSCSLVNHL